MADADPDLDIIEVDIFKNPRRAWRDGIRMIPALKVNDRVLSSLFLNKDTISSFLQQCK